MRHAVHAILVISMLVAPAAARTLRGLVFDDRNGDGVVTAGERGVANAIVAFGIERFATTNAAGEFTLAIPADTAGLVWVRVPDGFVPGPVWARVDADRHDPIELGLRQLAAPHRGPLTFVVAADTHVDYRSTYSVDLADVAIAATALEPRPVFFTILGDVTGGNEEHQFDDVDNAIAKLDVPFVPVPGNHDWYDGGEAWFRRYGPDNYSFDIADVHFVIWNMTMPVEDIERYLGAELSRVAPRMTIVAMSHGPPAPPIVDALRRLGVDFVLTGHTHSNRVVDHDGLVELTTEPLLMGGLDFTPAGYRVVTIDRGALATYHRTVVDEPYLAWIAPAPSTCVAPNQRSTAIVAAELDANTVEVTLRIVHGPPVAMRFAGGWSWTADLPALGAGEYAYDIDARAPSKVTASRRGTFRVCDSPASVAPRDAVWSQIGGSARHAGTTERVIAPPLVTRWTSLVGGHVLQATPVVGDGGVFVPVTDLGDGRGGGIVALELATGAPRWRASSPVPVRGSAAFAGGTIAAGQIDGLVRGFDPRSGAQRWMYDLGAGLAPESAGLWAPLAALDDAFLVGNQRHFGVFAGDDGRPRWTTEPVPGGAWAQSMGAVAVAGGVVVGAFHRTFNGVMAWEADTGTPLWRFEGEQANAIHATPVIDGDTVYVVNGLTEVIALDLASGEVRWEHKLDPAGFDWGDATIGTPAIAGGVLVVPTLYRDVVGIDARVGLELWRFTGTPSPLHTTHYRGARERGFEASPVITGDIVWVADTAGRLSALELRTGLPLWHVELGAPVLGGLAVAGDWLVIATYDGTVRALAPVRDGGTVADPEGTALRLREGLDGSPGSRWLLLVLALVTVFVLRRRLLR